MYVINVENDFFKPLGTKLNYYEILGIKPDSDSKTIKEAFYEQSKKLHPDKRYYTCITTCSVVGCSHFLLQNCKQGVF